MNDALESYNGVLILCKVYPVYLNNLTYRNHVHGDGLPSTNPQVHRRHTTGYADTVRFINTTREACVRSR